MHGNASHQRTLRFLLLWGVGVGTCLANPCSVGAEVPADALRLSMKAGEVRDFFIPLGGGELPELRAEVGRLTATEESGKADDLLMGFATPGTSRPSRWPENPPPQRTQVASGEQLHLRIMARRCATPGTYHGDLRLISSEVAAARPIVIPLLVTVDSGETCDGIFLRTGAAGLGALALGLVLFCGWSMWSRSHYLPLGELASKLRPQSWLESGTTRINSSAAAGVANRIRGEIRWQERLSAWVRTWLRRIRQKPWSAIWGGAPYLEVIRVALGNDPWGMALHPVTEAESPRGITNPPAPGDGRLYAVASNPRGVRIIAVPDREGKVGYLHLDTNLAGRTQIELLRPVALLRRESFDEDPTGPAGWSVG